MINKWELALVMLKLGGRTALFLEIIFKFWIIPDLQ